MLAPAAMLAVVWVVFEEILSPEAGGFVAGFICVLAAHIVVELLIAAWRMK